MTPTFWYSTRPAPYILRPFAAMYGCARKIHMRVTTPVRAPVPTVCVGNITAGGAGKTPVVQAVRHILRDDHPVVLLRGYGGRLAGPLDVNDHHGPVDVGDEAILLSSGGPVVVSCDRLAGARHILERGGRLVIMDDGFQNRQMAATVNLVVVDGAVGFGNGALLPAGPLREPVADGMARADAVVLLGEDIRGVRLMVPETLPVFIARIVPDSSGVIPGRRYIAFSGIARPQKFFDMLDALGVDMLARVPFPDHYAYTKQDVTALLDRAAHHRAGLITTEKDMVKVSALTQARVDTVPIRCVFDDADAVQTFLRTKVFGP
jgi:tetraacyldisaccharide 4'-kinase